MRCPEDYVFLGQRMSQATMRIPHSQEFTLPFHGRELKYTVSDLAGQANAAVIGQYGDTSVLVTAVMGNEDRPIDFFPLTVDYEERFYAAGKIIGSRFIRREGRPSMDAVLSGRLIDRSIRPLFDKKLRRDVQIVVTILSYDEQNDPDFVALVTTSLALAISDIPWGGPIAGVRMLLDGEIMVNPLLSDVEKSIQKEGTGDAFFSGTQGGNIDMIEFGGREISEAQAEQLFIKAQKEIETLVAFQKDIVSKIGKEKANVAHAEHDEKEVAHIRSFVGDRLEGAIYTPDAKLREQKLSELKKELRADCAEKEIPQEHIEPILEEIINESIHRGILERNARPDGRGIEEIRPLHAEVGLFSRLHGSGFFMRGATQSLAVTTLAAPGQEQLVETMEASTKRRFMLHYNFPPYSTGEVGRVGNPGRREIGHGALAEKALRAVIPTKEAFPYTIRVVSEILSSNGSSSMASVCAGTLSLMDAGVPITKPVAGIAMGLMTPEGYGSKETGDTFKVLTDLQGLEDHYGDMDFKVAGTKDGITAIQMDLKIRGISADIFKTGLAQAQKARFEILDLITKTIPAPRQSLSSFAPIIKILKIKPSQIGMVIGQGGKVINGIIEEYGLETIDIDDDGTVFIAGNDITKVTRALEFIEGITKEYATGEIVTGKVVRLLEFGAIVDLGGGKDGMIHVSEIQNGFLKNVGDVLKMGQEVTAKVIRVDEESGKIALSIKALAKE